MSLIKDGNIYRTIEEQVVHLTDAHREQLIINQNISRDLYELGISANFGGYNLVRFAFEKRGVYYKLAQGIVDNPIKNGNDIGDYFEITSHNQEDIPAYGYLIDGNKIAIAYSGDFVSRHNQLSVRNVTKGVETFGSFQYVEFEGSSLNDYIAQNRKKQVFNVINDLAYGTRTQYASFDLNNDGIYNFVFVGIISNGRNGYSVYVTTGTDVQNVVDKMQVHDLIQFAGNNTTNLVNSNAIIGDIYEYLGNENFEFKGNVRGATGATGATGETGPQGIQGVQGEQGIQGVQGIQGEPGKDGLGIIPNQGILNSPSELPDYSSVELGSGYVVLNTSGSTVSYDLYYKGRNGTEWSFIPNWGGVKGDKGDKGDKGEPGIQGIQGEQGPAGVGGILYLHLIKFRLEDDSHNMFYVYISAISPQQQAFNILEAYNYVSSFVPTLGKRPDDGRIIVLIKHVENNIFSVKYIDGSESTIGITAPVFGNFSDEVRQIN